MFEAVIKIRFNCFFLAIPALLNACGSPQKQMSIKPPTGMVFIPSGTFDMGGKTMEADRNELPVHKVSVSGFYMDATEVTNRQFAEFVDATGYKTIAEQDVDWEVLKKQLPPGTPRLSDSLLKAGSLVFRPTAGAVVLSDYSQWWHWITGANWRHPEGSGSSIKKRMEHPVVHVAWEDAQAYANWAGKRLPTEAEWEWAAQGGIAAKYPWGNESPEKSADKANFWQGAFPYMNYEWDGFFGTAPVKSFPPNGYGLYDMGGNVWEFCSDKYDANWYNKLNADKEISNNPEGSARYFDPLEPSLEKHVVRGGSFLCNDDYCSGYRVSRRMSTSRDSGLSHTGFRCAKDR